MHFSKLEPFQRIEELESRMLGLAHGDGWVGGKIQLVDLILYGCQPFQQLFPGFRLSHADTGGRAGELHIGELINPEHSFSMLMHFFFAIGISEQADPYLLHKPGGVLYDVYIYLPQGPGAGPGLLAKHFQGIIVQGADPFFDGLIKAIQYNMSLVGFHEFRRAVMAITVKNNDLF